MTASWKGLEGVTLAEKFQLQNLLFENGTSAPPGTRIAGGEQPVGWLWLLLADNTPDVRQPAPCQIAAGLSHPNLQEVWETGWTERGVTSMAYLLVEPADDVLATVLRETLADQVETHEVLLSAAKALSYLHARTLVHGNVEPPPFWQWETRLSYRVPPSLRRRRAAMAVSSAADQSRASPGLVMWSNG